MHDNIFKKWSSRTNNSNAVVELWDSMAQEYAEKPLPTNENNNFMKLLYRLSVSGTALDVGCGGGLYSLAIARECEEVLGIDISPKMIKAAQERANNLKIENVEFLCEDWQGISSNDKQWKNKFDFVFAHMTPAIQSAETFNKLTEACKGWCLISKPVKRTDIYWDKVMDILDLKEKRESADRDIMYGFQMLWEQGYLPYLEYEKQTWSLKFSVEKICEILLNRAKTYRSITEEESNEVISFLNKYAKNGELTEQTQSTIATMYWNVNK